MNTCPIFPIFSTRIDDVARIISQNNHYFIRCNLGSAKVGQRSYVFIAVSSLFSVYRIWYQRWQIWLPFLNENANITRPMSLNTDETCMVMPIAIRTRIIDKKNRITLICQWWQITISSLLLLSLFLPKSCAEVSSESPLPVNFKIISCMHHVPKTANLMYHCDQSTVTSLWRHYMKTHSQSYLINEMKFFNEIYVTYISSYAHSTHVLKIHIFS